MRRRWTGRLKIVQISSFATLLSSQSLLCHVALPFLTVSRMNLKMGGINNEPSKEDLKDKIHSETMVSGVGYGLFVALILPYHRLWVLILPTLHRGMAIVPL
jgi:hypothetical protein